MPLLLEGERPEHGSMRTTPLSWTIAVSLAMVLSSAMDVASPSTADAVNADAFPDFDDDGDADLVVAAPQEDIAGQMDAGAVTVLYGGAGVPGANGSTLLHEDRTSVEGVADAGDNFGTSWAAGDFDGDGYDDLAVGSNEAGVAEYVGGVHLFWGSSTGLTVLGDLFIDRNWPGVPGDPTKSDLFGGALAAGDFDGDGSMDLAVGASFVQHESGVRSGAVFVFSGAADTLTFDRVIRQGLDGIPGNPESDDRFGSSLAAGNFDGGAYDDLAIGAPNEDIGDFHEAGWLVAVEGSSTGLAPSSAIELRPGVGGVPGATKKLAHFGGYLAAGELHADGRDELLVCAAEYSPAGFLGALYVLKGSSAGPSGAAGERLTAESYGTDLQTITSESFCADTPAIGDIDGNGRSDVVLRFSRYPFRGAVGVLYGQGASEPLLRKRTMRISQSTPGVVGAHEPRDSFGASPRVLDFDGDGYGDVVVGVPGEDQLGVTDGGEIWMHDGPLVAIDSGDQRRVHQDSPGVPGALEADDGWGY